MDLLLGIDVGTTNCKAMVYDLGGNKVAGASRPTPTLFPRVGWAVYDPQQLWEVLSQALRDVVTQVGDPRQIRALAVVSMGEAGIPQVARETGLAAGTAVVTGGHDHVCGALALGVFEEGLILDSTGTAEAIILSCQKPLLTREVLEAGFCCECHVAPGRYVLLGVIITSGAIIEWFKEQLGQEEVRQAELRGRTVYDLLLEEAERSEPGARGLFLLPHLAGSCTLSKVQKLSKELMGQGKLNFCGGSECYE